MILRDYQNTAIDLIEQSETNVCLQMPTGSGKTITFCELAKRHFAEKVEKVLIIVHRTELFQQAFNSLGERCFRIEAGVKHIPHDFDYYIAMVETINRRIHLLPKFGLVIIDEAHIGNFRKLPFFEMDGTKVVGVTATPVSEKPLQPFLKKLIMPITINELIEKKYLVNSEAYGFASDLVQKANFKTTKGDYDEKQMEDFYCSEKLVKNVISAYWSRCAGKKTMIFNVNVAHNEVVYNAFKNENLNVYSIVGTTEYNERRKSIDAFKNDPHGIMCSVGVLTTGYDEPSIECIVLNRATKSLPLYFQMIGRGSRIYENKEKFIVIDLGKNTSRHGHYDSYIDWHTLFEKGSKKEGKGTGVPPIKECPECGFMQHTRKTVCESCGYSFEEEKLRQQAEEKEKKLVLLLREKPIIIPFEKLEELAKQREWKPYALLHKYAEHIINYENKHKDLITPEHSEATMLNLLPEWCKKYGKINNNWHKDLCKKILNEKRNTNTAGNSSVVPQQTLFKNF